MKLIFKTILLALLVTATGMTAVAQDSVVRSCAIGETNLPLIEKRFNLHHGSNALFINVHDNERTSVMVAEDYLTNNNGLLIRLDNVASRNVTFVVNGMPFLADPNRIFSQQGRMATLKLLSNNPSPDAEAAVEDFANLLLNTYINSYDVIVALHNNSDSNFSIITYQQQQQAKPASCKVFVSDSMDADDFILTTDTVIFNSLLQRRINAVWEDVSMIEDDGSLSVYAAMHNITYINIEAEHGHYEQQLALLNTISAFIIGQDETKDEETSREEYLRAPDK